LPPPPPRAGFRSSTRPAERGAPVIVPVAGPGLSPGGPPGHALLDTHLGLGSSRCARIHRRFAGLDGAGSSAGRASSVRRPRVRPSGGWRPAMWGPGLGCAGDSALWWAPFGAGPRTRAGRPPDPWAQQAARTGRAGAGWLAPCPGGELRAEPARQCRRAANSGRSVCGPIEAERGRAKGRAGGRSNLLAARQIRRLGEKRPGRLVTRRRPCCSGAEPGFALSLPRYCRRGMAGGDSPGPSENPAVKPPAPAPPDGSISRTRVRGGDA